MINKVLLLMIEFYKEHKQTPRYLLVSKDKLREYHIELSENYATGTWNKFHDIEIVQVVGEDRMELA